MSIQQAPPGTTVHLSFGPSKLFEPQAGAFQVDEHGPRQHQKRDRRHLPLVCDPQHTERYLAAYESRFNRRFDLDRNVERLTRVAAQTSPTPYRSIAAVRTGAEISG
jgi:hypothetical protein